MPPRDKPRKRTHTEMTTDGTDWQLLEHHGYVVLPVDWMHRLTRKEVRKQFRKTIASFPEYHRGVLFDKLVMGGFSALGNPASFHNKFVRRFRQYATVEVFSLFNCAIKELGDTWNIEQIIDRMCLRPPNVVASPESWHRDEASNAAKTDKIFGGWWNFGKAWQFFSCVPGSHKGATGNAGFRKIKPEEAKELTPRRVSVAIPPGAIIVFYEKIVHEVVSKKSNFPMYRLFLGWRLTQASSPLYPIESLLRSQAVMPLKSGQIPPMYAKLHWTNWTDRIVEFSKTVQDVCKETKIMQTGQRAGTAFTIVHQHMKSLEAYGLSMYPPYTDPEIALHRPTRLKVVRHPQTDTVVTLKFGAACN